VVAAVQGVASRWQNHLPFGSPAGSPHEIIALTPAGTRERPFEGNRNLAPPMLLLRMTQYFFDFRSSGVLSTDDEGQELPDVEAAHREAVEALADALQDFVLEGGIDQRITIDVRDELGPVLQVTAVFGSKLLRKQ